MNRDPVAGGLAVAIDDVRIGLAVGEWGVARIAALDGRAGCLTWGGTEPHVEASEPALEVGQVDAIVDGDFAHACASGDLHGHPVGGRRAGARGACGRVGVVESAAGAVDAVGGGEAGSVAASGGAHASEGERGTSSEQQQQQQQEEEEEGEEESVEAALALDVQTICRPKGGPVNPERQMHAWAGHGQGMV